MKSKIFLLLLLFLHGCTTVTPVYVPRPSPPPPVPYKICSEEKGERPDKDECVIIGPTAAPVIRGQHQKIVNDQLALI